MSGSTAPVLETVFFVVLRRVTLYYRTFCIKFVHSLYNAHSAAVVQIQLLEPRGDHNFWTIVHEYPMVSSVADVEQTMDAVALKTDTKPVATVSGLQQLEKSAVVLEEGGLLHRHDGSTANTVDEDFEDLAYRPLPRSASMWCPRGNMLSGMNGGTRLEVWEERWNSSGFVGVQYVSGEQGGLCCYVKTSWKRSHVN